MDDNGKIIGIIVAIVIACGIGYKFFAKGERDDDSKHRVSLMLRQLPDYHTHQALYLKWLDQHHDAAFDESYRRGASRRSSGKLNEDKYMYQVFVGMVESAEAEGYVDQAKKLVELFPNVKLHDKY